MAAKVLKMKLWPDATGNKVCISIGRLKFKIIHVFPHQKWKQSVLEIQGEVLCGR